MSKESKKVLIVGDTAWMVHGQNPVEVEITDVAWRFGRNLYAYTVKSQNYTSAGEREQFYLSRLEALEAILRNTECSEHKATSAFHTAMDQWKDYRLTLLSISIREPNNPCEVFYYENLVQESWAKAQAQLEKLATVKKDILRLIQEIAGEES